MPTFSVSGKRQQTISSVVIATDEAQAKQLFLMRNLGVTGIKIVRKKDVIMAEPTPETVAAVKEKIVTAVGKKRK